IPRIVWPNKPVWAGSGDLVTRFTGLHFAEFTSVGIGNVMELYVNFGKPGILIGSIILGILLGVVDRTASRHLRAGSAKRFLLWFVPGQSLLLVGGNFAEMTAAAAGCVIFCLLVTKLGYVEPQEAPVSQEDLEDPDWVVAAPRETVAS